MNRSFAVRSLRGACFLWGPVAACGMMLGCEQRQDVYSYDPKVDSVSPPALAGTDLSILEDQKSRPRPTIPAAPGGGAAAPGGAPRTTPATPGTPTTPTAPGTPGTPTAATPGATPGATPSPETATPTAPAVPTGAGTVPPPPITE